jgi:hypothetical protein
MPIKIEDRITSWVMLSRIRPKKAFRSPGWKKG